MTSPDPGKPTLRQRLSRLLRIVITVGLLAWLLNKVGIGRVLGILSQADLSVFALALILFQIGVVLRTVRWWALLRGSNVDAPFGPVLGLQYSSWLFNVALPTGFAGDVMRALEFEGADSKTTVTGIVILDRILGFATLFVVALVALVLGRDLLDPTTTLVLTIVTIVGLVGVAIALQGNLVRRLTRFLPERLSLAGEGWLARLYGALTGCSRLGIALALVISVLSTCLTNIIHYLIGRSLGIEVGLGVFFIVTPILTLTLLVPAIGGLGPREAGYQFLLAPLGVPGAMAVALGFGVYIVRASAALLGGLYYLFWSSRR
jgi:uncharacterized protein (TIRG00374 family)